MTQNTKNIMRPVLGSGSNPYSIHVRMAGTPRKKDAYMNNTAAIVPYSQIRAGTMPPAPFARQLNPVSLVLVG